MSKNSELRDQVVADHVRLSDKILEALELCLEQEDMEVAEQLVNALELSMTRAAGGKTYIERREYPERVDAALTRYHDTRRQKGFEV